VITIPNKRKGKNEPTGVQASRCTTEARLAHGNQLLPSVIKHDYYAALPNLVGLRKQPYNNNESNSYIYSLNYKRLFTSEYIHLPDISLVLLVMNKNVEQCVQGCIDRDQTMMCVS